MELTTSITITADEGRDLATILGCEESELAAKLAPYATAAVTELVTMCLGQKVFTRGSDLLEYRLLLLILHAFGGRIPDEQTVCNLFQTSTTGSRALIRAVMSKYQYQLKAVILATLKSLLDAADVDPDGNAVSIAVHNLNLVDELNRELADLDSSLPPVVKKRGSVSTYEIQPSSYRRLCGALGSQCRLQAP